MISNEGMDGLRKAIRQFLDYQSNCEHIGIDQASYTQLVAAYSIEWAIDQLKPLLTKEQIDELYNDLYNSN